MAQQMESTTGLCSDEQGKISLFCLFGLPAIALAVLLFASSSHASPAAPQSVTNSAEKLPTLTTARQAHSLSSGEAARAYPVHIKGVVTYFDENYGTGYAAVFMHDSTGSIFLRPLSRSVGWLTAGTVIDVQGVSGPGGFGPVVVKPQIRVIGHSALPANPPRVSLPRLETGAEDAQWVEVEGTIHAVSEYTHSITLQLAMIDGSISVTMPREETASYSNLVDAKVRIQANAAPTVNGDSQMIGVHLMAPNLSAIKVVEPAPGDPFSQSLIPIDKLLRWDAFSASFHRVHLRGNLTLQWPGSSLCIRDATRGICAQTVQNTPLAIGDLVDIVGFAGTEGNKLVLTDAMFRLASKGGLVAAKPVSVGEALKGSHDSDLIQMDGQLIGSDLTSSNMNLILTSGNTIFAAVLPKGMKGNDASQWKTGSKLRVTGICSVQIDARSHVREGVAVTKSFQILMRSPQDVVVLEGPSWWTAGHILVLLALALIATLCVLGWVMVLRKHVQEQANLLRESESRFRHMALHDALTGLATRLLLEDRLSNAVEAAKRHQTGVTLLIIDLDQFKDINDTFGHHCGDEVLRITADRLTQAVRKSDTVARLGGDEFVVLLPEVSDLLKAEGIAAKIVESLAEPVLFAGREVPVSASVGVCNSTGRELDAEALLKCADEALYRAKAGGRNCFRVVVSGQPLAQMDSIA
jgi:diguanylate cyclase (GGDEF)-like protein